MRNFAIISDSCCDLELALREKYGVEYVPMHYIIDEKDYLADLDWHEISAHEFYDIIRGGKRILTAQVTAAQYTEAFESHLKAGEDILSISCSSALSASVKASYAVRDELLKKYPEAKIVCIDSLNSCYGLGQLCILASELRAEGKSIEEIAAFIEEHKLEMNQECTVGKLTYLKQAGRVSAASAFFGGLLNIKPIIISDAVGNNHAVEKVKGRAASISRIAERVKDQIRDFPYQKLYFAHADAPEAAEELKSAVLEAIPEVKCEVHMGYIGPIVGASAGPGTIAVYFFGKKVDLV